MPGFIAKDSCRLCGSRSLALGARLEPTPLANDFRPTAQEARELDLVPLDLMVCNECAHFQLGVVVAAQELFADYLYSTGASASFRGHFSNLAHLAASLVSKSGALAVDAGSNDGTLLRALEAEGFTAVGIEPSRKHIEASLSAGLRVVPGFLGSESVAEVVDRYGKASLVTANNVFAHIDDLQGAFHSAHELLQPGGYLIFEVSYFPQVLADTLFDTVYHEHLDYHTLTPLLYSLEKCDFQVLDAQRIATHGGSLRVVARRGGTVSRHERVDQMINDELPIQDDPHRAMQRFMGEVGAAADRCADVLASVSSGVPIVGYSAPAKATTLIYQYKLDKCDIAWVADDNPLKQGRYMPGVGAPIVSSAAIRTAVEGTPLIIFAWNLVEEIAKQATEIHGFKGPIINPSPSALAKL